ncbi:autoinducer binding domain-containing protein [Mesorhizobium sp. M1348]|uniref:autoinducer binding domain-containing protein n=1 Tax=Mesorhizobium sp. M1348 TaxID=2957089 RepID=UPI00333CF709
MAKLIQPMGGSISRVRHLSVGAAQPEDLEASTYSLRLWLVHRPGLPVGASGRNRPCRSYRLPPLSGRHATETYARRALPVSSPLAGRHFQALDGGLYSASAIVGLRGGDPHIRMAHPGSVSAENQQQQKRRRSIKEVRVLRTWFQTLSNISSLAKTEAMLKEALTDAVRELGFDCYAYLNVQSVRTYAVSNYPVEWQQRYLERGYKNIDPVVTTARARMEAFSWAAASPRKVSTVRARAFYAEAGDFGIRSGITIPIRTAFGHISQGSLSFTATTKAISSTLTSSA